MYHPHVHYLVPAGALSDDQSVWIRPRTKNFFLPVKGLSRLFRSMIRDAIKQLTPQLFRQFPPKVWQNEWMVHCKAVDNGNAVLKYFAPYVFRVAISNKRMIKPENDQVTFADKDTDCKRWKTMTLPLLKKVRHFGYLSSRNKQLLPVFHYVFGTVEKESVDKATTQNKVPYCSICSKPMILIEIIGRGGFDVRTSMPKLVEKPP